MGHEGLVMGWMKSSSSSWVIVEEGCDGDEDVGIVGSESSSKGGCGG